MKLLNRIFLALILVTVILCQTTYANTKTTTYFHTDALGSIVAASDEDGDLIWRKTYDPYGNEIIDTGNETEVEEQTYTGKPYDDETGLVYLGQRYYDPQIRRFMGIDPVGFRVDTPVSFNRYAYANNNPYKYVDPDGRIAFIPFIVVPLLFAGDVALQTAFAPDVAFDSGEIQSIDIFPGPVSFTFFGLKATKDVGTSLLTNQAAKGLKGLQSQFDDLANAHLLPQFRKLDPNLTSGFTGSFKTGVVGNKGKPTFGQPIDLNNFDVDFFIKSDILLKKFGGNLRANPEFRKILSNTPGFEGLRANKKGFSIKFLPSSQ